MRTLQWPFAVLAMFLVWASPSAAQIGGPLKRPDIKTDLLTGGYDRSDPGTLWLGVRVKLGPGWKTYWRSPGDSGLPSEFDWSASKNIAEAETLWPAPHRMEIQGVETIGYTQEVVFPIKVRASKAGTPVEIALKLGLYACSTICVRDDHALTASIAPGESHPDQQAIIDAWRARLPSRPSDALAINSIRLKEASPPELVVTAKGTAPFRSPDLFVESDPPVFGSKPRVELGPDGSATLSVVLDGGTFDELRARKFTVTLVDEERAVEAASGAAGPAATSPLPAGSAGQALWLALAVALLGGFVLNLMPCVFPVLSLKLLAFVHQDEKQTHRIRAGFAASAAGIVASFLALATAMAVLRSLGATVGWGIQFQQPVFLGLMAAVLTLFAANLLGLFEIVLPSHLAGGLDRAGRGDTLAAHFGSGFVATLLATPCSAPFVGTAVGFALSRGPAEIYLVFAALGLGMALPYLLVVAFPGLATMLPRPGRWMLVVKQVMGAALLATAAWLLIIVATIAGTLTAMAIAALVAIVVAGLGLRQGVPGALKLALMLAVLAVPLALIAGARLSGGGGGSAGAQAIAWRPFNESDIRSLVGQGRTVFVDITADWCITCKVNKAVVLDGAAVKQRLATDAIPVQGDWTKPDARIAAYLQRFGRYGIPFNVVYGPGAPDGIVLPELLSESAVLDALTTAAGRPAATASFRSN